MKKMTHICLAMGISLIFLTVSTNAKDEQGLQYHSAREVSLVGFSSNYKLLEVSEEKPAGVKLPQFKGENPLFAKWQSPMIESGYLWIALDRTHNNGMHDNLYIDSNGNDHLADETPVTQYRMNPDSSYFGPVKVVFEVDDGPVTYHLNLRYYGSNDTKRIYAYAGGWYQGEFKGFLLTLWRLYSLNFFRGTQFKYI